MPPATTTAELVSTDGLKNEPLNRIVPASVGVPNTAVAPASSMKLLVVVPIVSVVPVAAARVLAPGAKMRSLTIVPVAVVRRVPPAMVTMP